MPLLYWENKDASEETDEEDYLISCQKMNQLTPKQNWSVTSVCVSVQADQFQFSQLNNMCAYVDILHVLLYLYFFSHPEVIEKYF